MRNTNRYSHIVVSYSSCAVLGFAALRSVFERIGIMSTGLVAVVALCDHVIVDPLFREIYCETVHYENSKHI